MKKMFVLKTNYERNGSALVLVLMVLMVVSLLGMTLLTVTTSNLKLTNKDRDNQAVYYIAEAGLREQLYKIKSGIYDVYSANGNDQDTFFAAIIERYKQGSYNYEQSFGKIPKATVTFGNLISSTENSRTYEIRSEGDIGGTKRSVSTKITVTWVAKSTSTLLPNVFALGNGFSFTGNTINGSGSTALVNGSITSANLNGGSLNGISNIYVTGSLQYAGSTTFGSSIQTGVIVIGGDYSMDSSSNVYGNVYIGGNYTQTNTAKFNGAVYIQGNANIKNGGEFYNDMYVGGDYTLTNTPTHDGILYIKGNFNTNNGGTFKNDIHVGGNFVSTNTATYKGNVYIQGDVDLKQGIFYKDVFVSGKIISNNATFKNGAKVQIASTPAIPTVPTMSIPQYSMSLRTDETNVVNGRTIYTWYQQNGYTQYDGNLTLNTIPNNFKAIVKGTFNSSEWTSPSPNTIIISKEGDINISGGSRNITGVLIAPNGSINLSGIASFTGVALSKNGVFMNAGGSTFNAKDLPEFFNQTTVPVIISSSSGTGSTVTSSNDLLTQLDYNAIREK